jgi:hypothetical protein
MKWTRLSSSTVVRLWVDGLVHGVVHGELHSLGDWELNAFGSWATYLWKQLHSRLVCAHVCTESQGPKTAA